MKNEINAEERRRLWDEALFDTETDDWDYGQWLVQALQANFFAIENFFGVQASSVPLLALVRQAAEDEGNSAPSTWREALEMIGINALVSWTTSESFRELGLYGRYGVVFTETSSIDREAHILSQLSKAEEIIEAFNIKHVAGETNVLNKIVNLARSRHNIDRQVGDVDPMSLALLGGISEGRIRNMMSGQKRELENTGGRISSSSALAWLQGRDEFFDSIWDQAEEESHETEIGLLRDVIFVPRSKDHSIFHPGLVRKGNFQIGNKNNEESFSCFEEALTALQKMGSSASWRRPNSSGNWGIVKVDTWIPMERTSLMPSLNNL
tara:strand:- start:2966 stop:3937 length:972 start_codon:yes stop_codon:yes gene_type:complete